jgi:DNA repair protein RecN (Recombination protein N)
VLAGAVEHRSLGTAALEAIVGDGGLTEVLGAVTTQLDGRAVFAEHLGRLRSVGVELSEVARDLRHTVEGIEEDPERLDEVRARRQLLRELRRKYGETLADVMTYRDEVTERLHELEGYEERAARLEAEREQCRADLRHAEAVVGASRRQAAPELARAVEAHLGELAMAKARLRISVGDDDPGDAVVFELAANPGASPLPLAKVASGGELARTMLALRLVLTEAPDTLVFDEVDAGIGGTAANAVARALAALGERHQVLVVTHLAQVAAAATQHVVITKQMDRDETVATATVVNGEDRVDEIARMLSGDAAIDSARRHARDLLDGGITTGSPVAR